MKDKINIEDILRMSKKLDDANVPDKDRCIMFIGDDGKTYILTCNGIKEYKNDI